MTGSNYRLLELHYKMNEKSLGDDGERDRKVGGGRKERSELSKDLIKQTRRTNIWNMYH